MFSQKNINLRIVFFFSNNEDPFSKPTQDPFGKPSEDPFSSKIEDPFAKKTEDPFGSSASWATDPFSAAPATGVSRSKTFSDDAFKDWRPPPNKTMNNLQKSETFVSPKKSDLVSQSLSRPWASPVDSTSSIPRNRPSRPTTNPNINHLDLNVDKKEKSGGKNLKLFKPFSLKKDKDKKAKSATPTAPLEEANVKMASEASKKAEKDRQERLRLQEEQDLAYAIALSKAEAASLNQQQ